MTAQNNLFLWIAVAMFVVTIVTGIWSGRNGLPYPVALMTVHKLIGIGTAVFAGLFLFPLLKQISAPALVIALIVLAAAAIVYLIATGGIMSAGKSLAFLRIIHIAATPVFAISAGGAIIMLISKT